MAVKRSNEEFEKIFYLLVLLGNPRDFYLHSKCELVAGDAKMILP